MSENSIKQPTKKRSINLDQQLHLNKRTDCMFETCCFAGNGRRNPIWRLATLPGPRSQDPHCHPMLRLLLLLVVVALRGLRSLRDLRDLRCYRIARKITGFGCRSVWGNFLANRWESTSGEVLPCAAWEGVYVTKG